MKFIFPQNYDFNSKLFGMLDYSTVIVNLIWYVFVFCLCNLLLPSLNFKVFFFILLCFPLLMFSLVGFNHENIIYVFMYLLKFFRSQKLYLYRKK